MLAGLGTIEVSLACYNRTLLNFPFTAMGDTILLIEDEAPIADTIVYALAQEGFRCDWHRLGREGVAAVRPGSHALAILDVGLPDGSGFERCKEIRAICDLPVIFLTARGDEIDRVVGLEIGADDYVVKPFSPRELVARIKAILRRGRSTSAPTAVETGFVVDETKARISFDGQILDLTRYEFRILKTLLAEPERVFSRAQLMDRAWDEPLASYERSVDAHIKTLRAKLRTVLPDQDPIQTHRGFGYSFDPLKRT